MKNTPALAPDSPVPIPRTSVVDLLTLTKPGITSLVLFTTFVGFYTGTTGSISLQLLCHTLIGTALASGGAGAFNMYVERQLDMMMKRTAFRPLPAGRLQPGHALFFALAVSISGFIYLYVLVNHLTSMLSAVTFAGYIFVYTPLKTRTWFSTYLGAVAGALPIVLGWTAANNALAYEAWMLFSILFLWQIPHFYAIGWMHREDYERAGFSLLPVIQSRGCRIKHQTPALIFILACATTLPYFSGISGPVYLAGAVILGFLFLCFGMDFARKLTRDAARRLFIVSAAYLPALFLCMIIDQTN